jgi:hypothetical protein
MKRKVRAAILGAILHSSAHAAVPGSPVEPSLDNGQGKLSVIQSKPSSGKKDKTARKKKVKPAEKPVAQQQDGANPADANEQTVQLRGLRG